MTTDSSYCAGLSAPIITIPAIASSHSPSPVRIVLALAQPPLPEGGAAGKTAIGLLRGLRAHGLDVRAVAARRKFAVAGLPPADLAVEVVPVDPPPRWRAHVLQLRLPRGELTATPFAQRVEEVAADADVVQLEEIDTAQLCRGARVPTVVHLHHLVGLDRDRGRPWQRRFRQVLELERAENAALRRHDYLLASSPRVADELRRRGTHGEVVVAPLSLDPELYEVAPLDGAARAGLIGTATWPTTAASMLWLVRDIWPDVQRAVPHARLAVAGRGTAELGLAGDGVEVIGEVESAARFLRELSVLVFPLERGSGMKVKVLEAMATGVPVVTTPPGAEGIAPNDGVVVCRDGHDVTRATVELLNDSLARRQRGAAGRDAFAARYAPQPATAPLAELYGRIASS